MKTKCPFRYKNNFHKVRSLNVEMSVVYLAQYREIKCNPVLLLRFKVL